MNNLNITAEEMAEIRKQREAEYKKDTQGMKDALELYYAGSPYAIAVRDIKANRVRTIKCK